MQSGRVVKLLWVIIVGEKEKNKTNKEESEKNPYPNIVLLLTLKRKNKQTNKQKTLVICTWKKIFVALTCVHCELPVMFEIIIECAECVIDCVELNSFLVISWYFKKGSSYFIYLDNFAHFIFPRFTPVFALFHIDSF